MKQNEHKNHPVSDDAAGKPTASPKKGAQRPALPPLRASDLTGQNKIDYELMQRVSTNQEAAVGELYDRFGSLVFRMAYQSMPTRAESEDAVQEIFVRLWRTADRYDPRKAALVTWVMLLTRRHLVDKLRRKRARIKTAMLDDSLASGIGAWNESKAGLRMEHDEHFEALVKQIDTLPELQKTVVMRAYLGGQTLRQISEELETPLGTIKSALSRALVRLRERTGEEVKS
ncbi:MAG: sigma-70 family RNA polymerase sigma factor [Phycisphaerales bacterium]|nr:sigma-70 family RNA polymerase sigma factor [Phycisphaerales bacterium]